MNAKDRLWSMGAGLLAIGVLLGAWFGAISPSLDAAARADSDRSAVETQNAIHETRLAALEEAAARIGELTAERDALAEGMPAGEEYSAFVRQLESLATQSGVTLSGITTASAMAYLPPAEAAAAEPAAETTGEPAADGEEAAAAPEQEPVPDPAAGMPVPFTSPLVTGDNLAAIPVTITVESGTAAALTDFLHRLQMGERLVSVSTATVTDPTDVDLAKLELSGFIYAMPSAEATVAATP